MLFQKMRNALHLILVPGPLAGAQFELQGGDMAAGRGVMQALQDDERFVKTLHFDEHFRFHHQAGRLHFGIVLHRSFQPFLLLERFMQALRRAGGEHRGKRHRLAGGMHRCRLFQGQTETAFVNQARNLSNLGGRFIAQPALAKLAHPLR